MLISVLAFALLIAMLRGGKLSSITQTNLRGWPLYLAGFAMQNVARWVGPYAGLLYSLSFPVLIGGSVMDRRISGMPLIAVGMAMNMLPVALNSGRMPVNVGSLTVAASAQSSTHSAITASTRLSMLGDLFRVPMPAGHYVLLSLGDLVLSVGAFLVVQRLLRPLQTRDLSVGGQRSG